MEYLGEFPEEAEEVVERRLVKLDNGWDEIIGVVRVGAAARDLPKVTPALDGAAVKSTPVASAALESTVRLAGKNLYSPGPVWVGLPRIH